MKQSKKVIFGFEIICVKTDAFHVHGGDENIRGLKLFMLVKDPAEQMSWLSEECYALKNPVELSRRVAVLLCSTHNGKGGRNQLCAFGHQSSKNSSSNKSYAK